MTALTPAERLERTTWDTFWIPTDAVAVARDEAIYLRAPQDRLYLNMVLKTRVDRRGLEALMDEVGEGHRRVRSLWPVFEHAHAPWVHEVLDGRGWRLDHVADARAVAVDRFVARPAAGLKVRRVMDEADLRIWYAVTDASFGGTPTARTDAEVARDLQRSTGPSPRVVRFVAWAGACPVSAGGMTLHATLGTALLWSGGTVPSHRGRGAYSAVVAARVEWARRQGARWAGLFARRDTSSPIVAQQGFEVYGRLDARIRAIGAGV